VSRVEAQRQEFERNGYAVARGVLAPQAMAIYCQAAMMQKPKYWLPEPAHHSRGRYADAHGEALLLLLQPLLEGITSRRLYPCYSFLRVYSRGSELVKHTDRPSCEYSVTLTVGGEQGRQWPIWVEGAQGPAAVDMAPGDLMVYKGAALPHWREPFDGEFWVQLFLHYVDAEGAYAHYRYDGRPRLGPFNIRTEQRNLPDPTKLKPTDPCWCGSGKALEDCHAGQLMPTV
jgi:hypothetical protein